MIKIQTRKSKTTQYAIGAAVAVIIIGLWVSLPLMNNSSLDSSMAAGNPFKSKVADISMLGSDIPSEGGAPGSPLSGEMINNPATSGEDIASSLFQSGISGDEVPVDAPSAGAEVAAPAPAPHGSGSAVAPAPAGPRSKLNAVASITGGNSNSMTAGGVHNKFFGAGAGQKPEITANTGPDLKKISGDEKRAGLVAMLNNTADKSQLAAKSGNADAARGGATSAFANTAKTGGSDLGGKLEHEASVSGLQLGQTAQDLKKNDPSINKHKVNIPEPKPKKDEKADEEFKKMLVQLIFQSVIGPMFSTMAQSMFSPGGTTAPVTK